MYDDMHTKICTKCNQNLPLEKFSKHKRNPDGLQYWCKLCAGKYNRNLYHTNPEYRKNQIELNNYDNSKERQKKYFKSQKGKIAQKRYFQSDKGKEARSRADKKHRQTESYRIFKTNRDRKLQWIPLIENPFPDDVKIHWHHINNVLVIPLPEETHRYTFCKTSQEHRDFCREFINKYYLLNLDELLC